MACHGMSSVSFALYEPQRAREDALERERARREAFERRSLRIGQQQRKEYMPEH